MDKGKQKVLLIIGTRPECVKLAPVVHELKNSPESFVPIVVSTGQHKEMLKQTLEIFDIQPDHHLEVMTHNQSLSGLTASLFTNLDAVIQEEKPDWIFVQGDTTSVMVAALVGYYHRIRVAHIEAGLRTHNKYSPFPEEVNRSIAGIVADVHFAPTPKAKENLLKENIPEECILVTGNTVIDAVNYVADYTQPDSMPIDLDQEYVLVTAHRRENFGQAMQDMFSALKEIALRFPDIKVVYPVHLNPNVQEKAQAILSGVDNVLLLEPLDYVTFVHMMKNARLILTDSGGVQEEAPSFGVPVLVMRTTTERPEGVEAGVAKLVGTSKEAIVSAAIEVIENRSSRHSKPNPFGDGQAAKRIVESVAEKQSVSLA